VILDRDGTLIDVVRDAELGHVSVAFHPDHIRLLPGVVEGLRLLEAESFRLAIATNQPGPAKGQYPAAAVERTNRALVEVLASFGITIEHVAVCMHHPDGGPGGDPSLKQACDCRKPKGGLIREVLSELDADASKAWMIGDTSSDLDAARAAGVRGALVFAKNRCELCPLRSGPGVCVLGRSGGGGGGGGHGVVWGGTFDDVARRVIAAAHSTEEQEPDRRHTA